MFNATLDFAPPTPAGFAEAMVRFAACGIRAFVLSDDGPLAREAVQLAARQLNGGVARVQWFTDTEHRSDVGSGELPWPAWRDKTAGAEVCRVWFTEDEATLAARLHSFVDREAVLLAPQRSRHFSPCTTVTIPKSGTHLLFELLDEFGTLHSGPLPAQPCPRRRYFPATTSHLPFRNVETLPDFDAIDGGYSHRLWQHPLLFMYRNPLDVLCSEAAWYARPGATYLAHHYAALDRDERLRRLIVGDAAQPPLRERLFSYAGWLEIPNVIPVSYEELVGERGGGDLAMQIKLVWSLQLKLQIPGSPQNFSRILVRRGARTFHKGRMLRFLEELGSRHVALLREQGADYFRDFGYDLDDLLAGHCLPRHVDRYRTRPLRLADPACKAIAPTVPDDLAADDERPGGVLTYRGYRLAAVRDQVVAMPRDLAEFRFPDHLGTPRVKTALRLSELRLAIDADPLGNDPLTDRPDLPSGLIDTGAGIRNREPTLVYSCSERYNVHAFQGAYVAVDRRLGEVNLLALEARETPGVLWADSFDEIQRVVQDAASADEAKERLPEESHPVLVDESMPAYNIVRFDRRFYAVPRALGRVDFFRDAERRQPAILEAGSLSEALQAASLADAEAKTEAPELHAS